MRRNLAAPRSSDRQRTVCHWFSASETGALRTLACEQIREIRPGEIVVLQGQVARSFEGAKPKERQARCTFEHIYFSRPDATWDGLLVHQARHRLGEELAREHPAEADVVIPVPDSGVPSAVGDTALAAPELAGLHFTGSVQTFQNLP